MVKRREVLALLLAGTALGIFFLSISFAVAEFLPGAVEQRDWLFTRMGAVPVPPIYSNPIFGLFAVFTCFTPFTFLLAVIAALLWRSAREQRRNEQDRHRQLSDWSTTALLHEIAELLRTTLEGKTAFRSRLEETRRATHPHLIGLQRRFFERFLERLGLVAAGPGATARAASGPRRWPRLVVNALAVGTAGQVGMAALTGITLSTFDEMPVVGLPLGASAAFQGASTWMVGAVVWGAWALGLKRFERSATRSEEQARTSSRNAIERLREGLLVCLKRLDTTGDLVAESHAHKVASALAGALVEAADRRDKRFLLEALYACGRLRQPHALDLRGIELGGLDLSNVEWPQIQLPGANLEGVSFADAWLEDADLSNCRLRGASFQSARCSGLRLRAGDLTAVRAQRADFRKADLSACDLTQALLWGADLSSADLRDTVLDDQQSDSVASARGALGLS